MYLLLASSGSDDRLCPSGRYGPTQCREVVCPHLTLTIDEKAGSARDPAYVGALDICCDVFTPPVALEVLGKRLHIESDCSAYRIRSLGANSS